jgi:hypothetical protein
MFKDGFGNEIVLGSYLVYAVKNGMRIARVFKKTETLGYGGSTTTTMIVKVYDRPASNSYGAYTYKTALRAVQRTMIIHESVVPSAIRTALAH